MTLKVELILNGSVTDHLNTVSDLNQRAAMMKDIMITAVNETIPAMVRANLDKNQILTKTVGAIYDGEVITNKEVTSNED